MATYYVKNGGNDGNSGLSDLLAWATVGKVNGATFAAGDSILFKRAGLWRGTQLVPHNNGTSGHQITYGNYDSGALPIITQGVLITNWTVYSGNIWQASLASEPGWIFMDGNIGDRKTSTGALVNEFDFYWNGSNTVYIYAATDPDSRYVSPGVERYGTTSTVQPLYNYITLDGLCLQMGEYGIKDNYPGSYWIVQNCLIRYFWFGLELGNGGAYSEWNIRDNEFCYCNTIGVGPGWAGTNIRIYRNNVHHIDCLALFDPRDPGTTWTAGIKLFAQDVTDGMSGTDIYENYVHDCGRGLDSQGCSNGVGIWPDTVHPSSSNPIKIHHNFLEDCTGEGVMVEISSDCHVYGNVIWKCGTCSLGEGQAWATSGILLSGRLDFATNNNLFYNNTIYGCNIGINVSMDNYNLTTGRLDNNIFKNNIVLGSITRPFSAGMGGDNDPAWNGSGNVYQYNCFGAQATNFISWGYGVFYSTYAAWEANARVIKDGGTTHSINADPSFTNAAAGDFTLQAASPCINAGVNLGTVYKYGLMHDSVWPAAVVLGDQGAHGAGWEVGAYIYEAGGSAWIVGALAVGGS